MIYGVSAKVQATKTNCLDTVYITYTNIENGCNPVQISFFDKDNKVTTTWLNVKSLSNFQIVEIPKSIRESTETMFAFTETPMQVEYIILDLIHYQRR